MGNDEKYTKQSILRPIWNLLGNIKSQIGQGKLLQDIGVVHDLIKTAANGGAQNDREYLLERMVGMLSTLPVCLNFFFENFLPS